MPDLTRRLFSSGAALGAASLVLPNRPARAAGKTLTIGVVLPMSGFYANQGALYENGMKVFQALRGTEVAGMPVKLVVRDDQGPNSGDLSRRLTQELVVRDKADVVVGYSFTPNAMAAASLLTEAKKMGVIVNAATSIITEKSPDFVRVSFTTPQVSYYLGKYVAEKGLKKVFTIASDYAPGIDSETWFIKAMKAGGGSIVGGVRTPVTETEYAPYLQKAIEAKPDAIFAFNPGGDVAVAFLKAVKQSGLQNSGIKLTVTGDVLEDDALALLGENAEGAISTMHWQYGLKNKLNQEFIAKFKEIAGASAVPNFRAVQGYDGLNAIYYAVEKTKGDLSTPALLQALAGASIESPRGTFQIDAKTRDIIQTMYVREARQVDGMWQNVEIASYPMVGDPAKDPSLA